MPTLESENTDFLDDLDYQEEDCTDLVDQYEAQYEYERQDLY